MSSHDTFVPLVTAPCRGLGVYGLTGPAGQLYRGARAPIWAASGQASPERWARHLSEIAETFPMALPGIHAVARVSAEATHSPLYR